MHKFGLAIHLKDFAGHVTVKGNEFTGSRLNFNDFCTFYEDEGDELAERRVELFPLGRALQCFLERVEDHVQMAEDSEGKWE